MPNLMPSDPDYEHVNVLAEEIAMLMNPQVWFDLQETCIDTPEYRAGIQALKNELQELFNSNDIMLLVSDVLEAME